MLEEDGERLGMRSLGLGGDVVKRRAGLCVSTWSESQRRRNGWQDKLTRANQAQVGEGE